VYIHTELHSLYQAVSTWFKCMEISPDVSVALQKAASVHGQAVYIVSNLFIHLTGKPHYVIT